ncbi:hypothetical protein VT99_13054, partial [Candidatus Electrothrix marina]
MPAWISRCLIIASGEGDTESESVMGTYKMLTIKMAVRQGEVRRYHERRGYIGMKGPDRKAGERGQSGTEKNRVRATHVPGF